MSPFTIASTGVSYPRLDQALTVADAGATILALPGTYPAESAMITKAVTLKCADAKLFAAFDGRAITSSGAQILGINTPQKVVIEGFELFGNRPGTWIYNAGLQSYSKSDVTMRRCRVYNNNNGLLSGLDDRGGTWRVHDCELFDNGTYNGLDHNAYIDYLDYVEFVGCWSHMTFFVPPGGVGRVNTSWGHLLKIRAKKSRILGCRLTQETGESNRCIDLPNAGDHEIAGCLIEYRTTQNQGLGQAVSYGVEGLLGLESGYEPTRKFGLKMHHNTIVNRGHPQAQAIWISQAGGAFPPIDFQCYDNVFAGWMPDQLVKTDDPDRYYVDPAKNTFIRLDQLRDAANYDYRLAA